MLDCSTDFMLFNCKGSRRVYTIDLSLILLDLYLNLFVTPQIIVSISNYLVSAYPHFNVGL